MALGIHGLLPSQSELGLRRSSRINGQRHLPLGNDLRRSARIATKERVNYSEAFEESELDGEPTIVSFGERVEILARNDFFGESSEESLSEPEYTSRLRQAVKMQNYWNRQVQRLKKKVLESGENEEEVRAALALLSFSNTTPSQPLRSSRRVNQQNYVF